MIAVGFFNDVKELEHCLSACMQPDKSAIMSANYGEVLGKLQENGRKRWHAIRYRGRISEMKQELSVIKSGNYPKYFMHASMSEPLFSDVITIIETFNAFNECDVPDWDFHVTSDSALSDKEADIIIIAAEYELGWDFHLLLNRNSRQSDVSDSSCE